MQISQPISLKEQKAPSPRHPNSPNRSADAILRTERSMLALLIQTIGIIAPSAAPIAFSTV
jgi:hypothetical protein